MSSDSPRSEMLDTRFSTPAPELDDHRHIPRPALGNEGEPSQDNGPPIARRSSLDRSGLLQVNNALRDPNLRLRDFENVIIDDDRSEKAGEGAGGGRRGVTRDR